MSAITVDMVRYALVRDAGWTEQEAEEGIAAARAESDALRAALEKALEVIRDAERELHVWVDRDRARHPGWPDVGYEPWNNKPSLALWAVDVDEVEQMAHDALAPSPAEPAAPERLGRHKCPRCSFTGATWARVVAHQRAAHPFQPAAPEREP